LYADQARQDVAHLKARLEKLTVPQQREILNEIRGTLVGGIYRKMPLHVMPARAMNAPTRPVGPSLIDAVGND
jgi:hypothetical protein